jgi:hypothetical protein
VKKNTDESTHSEYKKNTGMNSRTENLLRERGSIHGVDHIADQLIAYVIRPVSLLHLGRNCETRSLTAAWFMHSQAQEARDQLAGQRSLLQNTLATLAGMRGTGPFLLTRLWYVGRSSPRHLAGSLPGINSIMGSIKKKKYRDMVVLGSFIAFCICFLLFYWLRS